MTTQQIIDKAVAWAIQIASDNSHGYSQQSRWGTPDYDCSSFVISAWQEGAGVPVRKAGATYTGNMKMAFLACGFEDVTDSVGLSSGYGIQAGDVLLNDAAHTCLAIGNGKVANCRTDEGHPQGGDQSGNEIRVQAYWNYPWTRVLRFKGSENVIITPTATKTTVTTTVNEADHRWTPRTIRTSNSYNSDCVVLQALLNARHFACGEVDGFFGAKTQAAVHRFQQWAGIEVDGVVGTQTWKKLLETG